MPWLAVGADISIPFRIWHGRQDPWVTDADIEALVNAIPRTSLVVWPDRGHLGFIRNWGEILTAVATGSGAAG